MLVLSRKENQSILFPNLGITVEIRRIAGKAVRVGIDAPPDVRILRQELAPRELIPPQHVPVESRPDLRHELRNRLNTTGLALQVLQKQLENGLVQEAEETLTLALDEIAHLDDAVGNFAKPPGAHEHVRPRRALLVEDNANERELLAELLRMNGYEVDTAEDGAAALSYLSEHRPDLVLLDMRMPNMDGSQTIAAIRGNPNYRGLKVFAVSGSERDSVSVETGPNGIDRWFSKPISPSQFVRALERELSRVALAV